MYLVEDSSPTKGTPSSRKYFAQMVREFRDAFAVSQGARAVNMRMIK